MPKWNGSEWWAVADGQVALSDDAITWETLSLPGEVGSAVDGTQVFVLAGPRILVVQRDPDGLQALWLGEPERGIH